MKKRIMHVLYCNNFGGAERVVLNILKSLSGEFEMVFVAPHGPFESVLRNEKVQFIPIDECSPRNIRKVSVKWKPDIIHAHDFRASIFSALSSTGVPVVSHLHTSNQWIKGLNINSLSYLAMFPRFKKIISVSNTLVNEMRISRFLRNKMIVIPNVVDKELLLKKATEKQVIENYDLAFIGRYSPEKNPLRFIRIVSKLKEAKSDIKGVMVGDGQLMNECQRYIVDLDLSENIKIIGYQENPYPYIQSAKICVITSEFEAFSLVALESLVLSKPVFTTAIGGPTEFIHDSCGGLCHDDKSFVSSILRALSDESYYSHISKGAAIRANELLETNNYKEMISSIYLKC